MHVCRPPYPPRMTLALTLPETQVLLQSISSFALACGLIYTAMQFRKQRRTTHVANFTRLVQMQMHLREMRVDDPRLAEVYLHDMQGLHGEREVREYFFNLMQLSVFEIVWFSHRHGELPHDYYEGWRRRMEQIAAEPSFQKMMRSPSMKILHDDFQKMMERMVAAADQSGERQRGVP